MADDFASSDGSAVNHYPTSGHSLEVNLPLVNFDLHKVVVFIKTHVPKRALEINVAAPHLSARAGDEVLNALLRFGALINVIMSGKNGLNAVLGKERFKHSSQLE